MILLKEKHQAVKSVDQRSELPISRISQFFPSRSLLPTQESIFIATTFLNACFVLGIRLNSIIFRTTTFCLSALFQNVPHDFQFRFVFAARVCVKNAGSRWCWFQAKVRSM